MEQQLQYEELFQGCRRFLEAVAAWPELLAAVELDYGVDFMTNPAGTATGQSRQQGLGIGTEQLQGELLPDKVADRLLERELLLTEARLHVVTCQAEATQRCLRRHNYANARVGL